MHTTQFAIRAPRHGLLQPVLELAMEVAGEHERATARHLIGTEANSQQSQLLSARLQAIRKEKQELQRQLAHYETLLNHVPPSVVLAEISHQIPDEASLKNFVLAPLSAERSSDRKRPLRSSRANKAHSAAPAHCRMKATITAHATDSQTMKLFVRSLKESALFAEVKQLGMGSKEVSGIKIKAKTIELYVLDAECIAP